MSGYNKAVHSVSRDIIEVRRLKILERMVNNNHIFCECGELLTKLVTYPVNGDGVVIDGIMSWVLLTCQSCGHVDNWRTVMRRYGI